MVCQGLKKNSSLWFRIYSSKPINQFDQSECVIFSSFCAREHQFWKVRLWKIPVLFYAVQIILRVRGIVWLSAGYVIFFKLKSLFAFVAVSKVTTSWLPPRCFDRNFTTFLEVKATYCCQYLPIFLLAKLAYLLNFKILGVHPGLPLMILPLEAVEVRETQTRDRASQVTQLPGNRLEKPIEVKVEVSQITTHPGRVFSTSNKTR